MIKDRFDVDPGRSGHQPDQDPPETQPVGHPRPVTAQRVFVDSGPGQQPLDHRPDDVRDFGLKRAHDVGVLHQSSGLEQHPKSESGQPDDRWMVTYPRES
jgi:hypothetical protein